MQFSKEVKMIIAVYKLLHSLIAFLRLLSKVIKICRIECDGGRAVVVLILKQKEGARLLIADIQYLD